tara:strand:+ start:5851 stop:6810 length:960 start_codon:yes stop_codon:yes gene_type:complete
MAQTTGNSANIVKQQIYGEILQESYKDNLMGLIGMNDLTSEFPVGDTFNVDQIGQATLSDYAENTDIDYSAIDTSRITLALTDYVQDGFYVTDKLKMDAGGRADRLWSTRVKESSYAFGKRMEGDLYAAANATQTATATNAINGQPHRIALATGYTAQNFVDAVADCKLSFDKANVPESGRVLIVDAKTENKLNKLATGAVLVADSPRFEGLLTSGFAKAHRFIRNIHGFDIFVSNLLPVSTANETVDSVQALTGSEVCIAMCVADEDCKPMMGVIRQHPTAAFERQEEKKRDAWSSTAYWGFALYRPESLICLITDNS